MDAVEAVPAAPDEDRRPVGLVFVGYVATVMLPTIGILFALVALTRPGRWAKRQGILMAGLATLLIAFGVALLPMVTDSYFASKANGELSVSPREARRDEEESNRRLREQISRVEREAAAVKARNRQVHAGGGG